MEPSITPSPVSTSTHAHFPTIGTLFRDSWAMFKGSVLNLVVVNIIYIAVSILLLVVSAALLLPFGGITVIQAVTNQTFKPEMLIPLFISGGIILFVLVVILTYISFVVTAAQIFIAGNHKEKNSLGLNIKKSFPKVLPLFVVGIITGFIVTGGFLLFVIPGIIFSIFFMFVSYEIVLNNQGILSSVKRSVKLVGHNFWEIFVRVLLLVGLYIAFSIGQFFIDLPISLLSQMDDSLVILPIIWTGISYFIEFFIGIYILCYALTLYKQASSGLESEKGSGKPVLWMLISSIVGWIVGVLLIVTIGVFIWSTINSKQAQTAKPNTTLEQLNNTPQKTSTRETLKKNDELYSQIIKSTEKETVEKINDERIQMLVSAVEVDPTSTDLWTELTLAYTYANTLPNPTKDMIYSAKKILETSPNSYDGFSLLGLAYYYDGDAQNAVLQFEKANRIDPSQPDAQRYTAESYEALKIYDQAIAHYNKAIELYEMENANGLHDAKILEMRKALSRIQ